LAQAEPLYIQTRDVVESMGADGHALLPYVLDGLGQLRFDQGRWKDAETLLRRAVSMGREVHGETHPSTLAALRHLGQLLVAQESAEAEGLFQNQISTVRQTSDLPGDFLASCLTNFATFYVATGRYELAEPLLQESSDLIAQHGANPLLADNLLDLGTIYRMQHNDARAEPLFKKALHIYESADDPHQAGALQQLGMIALDEGKYTIAKERLSQSLGMYQHVLGSAHMLVARVKASLAEAFLGEHNYTEAKSLIQDALATERKTLGEDHATVARVMMVAGKVEEQGHRDTQAAEYYRQATEIYRRSLPSGNLELRQAEKQYARFAKSLRN
jgi:tetratricopeptide (TPR) repeat protein